MPAPESGSSPAGADRLAEVQAACEALTPGATSFVADLSELAGIAALADRIVASVGPIDVLVNNAGVPKRRRRRRR